MPKIHPVPLALALTAGAAIAQPHTPSPIERESANINPEHIAHIYYNLVTGEKIATRLSDDFRPAVGNPGTEQWIAANDQPCRSFGVEVFSNVFIDSGCHNFCTSFDSFGSTLLDWGDIPPDTTIDCVDINWFTDTRDTDSNSDGIGDGAHGFATQWSFYDSDNGFNTCSRQSLISFRLLNLPGSINGEFAMYSATIDLTGDFKSSIAFEYGDSDGILNTASTHNPFVYSTDINSDGIPDGDVDSDGLADMSYAVRFFLPGIHDSDNADGDNDQYTGIDGEWLDAGQIFVSLAAPSGTTIETDNGDGTFSYEIDTTTATGPNAFGAEDAWDKFDDLGNYTGTYWTGGFSCEDDPDNHITPNTFGQIKIAVYGPSALVDCGDHNGDGVLDIFDVFAFLDLYNAGDLAADYTGDGTLDIFDVFAFLDVFNAGCP